MYKNEYTHTHTHTLEYYSAIKKAEIRPLAATWMQLEISYGYMWNLKYDTNEPICETNRLMDIQNRLMVAKGEGEVGVSRCKLLYMEWINKKILLYSRENYVQYPMTNHRRGSF